MGLAMAVLSGYFMWKSAELPIMWVQGVGPGGGAWPFWLSLVMLLSTLWILFNWAFRIGAIANNEEPLFEAGMFTPVALVALALTGCIALIEGIGIGGFKGIGFYGALPLFIIFYLKVIGSHTWVSTLTTAIVVPVLTFVFFEVLLQISLPKGMTEPLFLPIYAFIYSL
ncbi:MAG: hypothetical protein APF80_03955 [Alphaproteobacteria bacterium BRH_c36]|nr:MAG: hypothetical protein APF80_03955 [Alphaproteobacteria bacterium BRH_c36]